MQFALGKLQDTVTDCVKDCVIKGKRMTLGREVEIRTWNTRSMNKKTLEVAETLSGWGWTNAVSRTPEGGLLGPDWLG